MITEKLPPCLYMRELFTIGKTSAGRKEEEGYLLGRNWIGLVCEMSQESRVKKTAENTGSVAAVVFLRWLTKVQKAGRAGFIRKGKQIRDDPRGRRLSGTTSGSSAEKYAGGA